MYVVMRLKVLFRFGGSMRQSGIAKVQKTWDCYALSYDQALRGAILLQYPKQLLEILSSLLSRWLGVHAHLSDLNVNILGYKPGRRCVFELDFILSLSAVAPKQHRRVIGKIYANSLGEKVYETLQQLWSHGFAVGRFNIPQPLAYDADWRLLLMSWTRGNSLDHLLLNGLDDLSKAIIASAEWLVKLHKCRASERRRHDFSRLHKLGMWQRYLGVVYPEAEPLLADVRSRIDLQREALSGWLAAPTHCDYTPNHLIIDDNQVTGVDFDEFGQYDPLFDVAHFVVHLRYLGLVRLGSLNCFDWLARLFQDTYKACVDDYSPKRVRLYMVIVYLKLVYFNAFNRPTQDWKKVVDILLHEARQIV